MYHGNVAGKLSEFLPQGLFAWKFGGDFETVGPRDADEATVSRTGTMTLRLGWWKRKMFWNSVVKALPDGEAFPDSDVTEFDDCDECPAKQVFNVKNGGLDGAVEKGWRITGITLIKLAKP